jgi:hypothetical protein
MWTNSRGKTGEQRQNAGKCFRACAAKHAKLGACGLFGTACHWHVGIGNSQERQFAGKAAGRSGSECSRIDDDLPKRKRRLQAATVSSTIFEEDRHRIMQSLV